LIAQTGDNKVEFVFDPHLAPGRYSVSLFLRTDHAIRDWRQNCLPMEIQGPMQGGYENPKELQGPILSEFSIIHSA
jgi:hypothetical protein